MEKVWWSTMPPDFYKGGLFWVKGVEENDVFYYKDMRCAHSVLCQSSHRRRRRRRRRTP